MASEAEARGEDFVKACQALEKIATGQITGERDGVTTAQIMRDIANEALVAVKYESPTSGGVWKP